jgi:hypothetical protein
MTYTGTWTPGDRVQIQHCDRAPEAYPFATIVRAEARPGTGGYDRPGWIVRYPHGDEVWAQDYDVLAPGPLMRVRVRDRSAEPPWGQGLTDPAVRTVTISTSCPVCGGPRGIPRNLNQADDGVHYSVDVWDNPCGHTDLYTDVVIESYRTALTLEVGRRAG